MTDAGSAVFGAVYADGSICLDILQNQWSPIYDVAAVLTSIQVRLTCNRTSMQASTDRGCVCLMLCVSAS